MNDGTTAREAREESEGHTVGKILSMKVPELKKLADIYSINSKRNKTTIQTELIELISGTGKRLKIGKLWSHCFVFV
jgi:hypothetical protein